MAVLSAVSQLQLLCAQTGSICNKSTVDVMGWDFIVEFPGIGPARLGQLMDWSMRT
ncbi:hypothetical protein NLM33_24240 [Bradyrhizobium sp. CCGUVB1N3]|uniref:hypothetical protein n=1 Tax=Bradyrhizobium sp. CCGUVB1N3 TaxID=2949629 RepID=UPI0020B1D637|nr:hypothetical protein [Bradyrhizobium sp. CCGUVB1N3]MCP3473426.1 hypothetical protein [Bradyrhizobium sp. CCGUVB1N3]